MDTPAWALFDVWMSPLWLPAHPAWALSGTQSVSFLSQLERAGSLTAFLFGLHPTVPQQPVPYRVGGEGISPPAGTSGIPQTSYRRNGGIFGLGKLASSEV